MNHLPLMFFFSGNTRHLLTHFATRIQCESTVKALVHPLKLPVVVTDPSLRPHIFFFVGTKITMGRVARYKKIKACDPFAKGNRRKTIGGETVWGIGDDGRKLKKRSRTAEKLRAQRKKKTKLDKFTDRAFDAPPDDGDEFDMKDLIGSVKKNKNDQVDDEIIRVSIPAAAKYIQADTPPSAKPARANNLQE
jgi:hypothetical protein